MDFTGGFPAASARDHKCIMASHVFDANAILVEPLKSKKLADFQAACNMLHTILVECGI